MGAKNLKIFPSGYAKNKSEMINELLPLVTRESLDAESLKELEKLEAEEKALIKEIINNTKGSGLTACLAENIGSSETIGKHLLGKTQSYLGTSRNLDYLAGRADSLANHIEGCVNRRRNNEPAKFRFIRTTSEPADIAELRKLKIELSSLSDWYYNNHKFTENRDFIADDDPDATPATFFSWKRIKEFARKLPDNQAKHQYLLRMKLAFEEALDENDSRGFIKKGKDKRLCKDEGLLRKLNNEITVYEKTSPQPQETRKTREYSQFDKKRILDTAVRLFENCKGKWREEDLIDALGMSKNTFYTQKKFFGWERIRMLYDEVKAVIRENEKK